MEQIKSKVMGHKRKTLTIIELKVPKEYQLQGARLAIMTQKLAYDWIIKQLKGLKPITKRGQENIKDTMDALEDSGSPRPTEQKLWKDLKYFQNKKKHWRLVLETIHNRLRSGAYWKNVPGYEERAILQILPEPRNNGPHTLLMHNRGKEQIWEMAERLYNVTHEIDRKAKLDSTQ